MLLKYLRKKTIKNNDEINAFLGGQRRRIYIEAHYEKIKLYRYLLFLRKKGANLNKFFDQEILKMNRQSDEKN